MDAYRLATTLAPHTLVTSVDHLASSAGVATLRAGGNAADAAVATSAVLAVTCQHLCGMGGDLWALVHDGGPLPHALDASGRAGSGADPARLRAEGHRAMPFEGDIRAVPVPGCVDGWLALHGRFGRLPLADVLGPAIGYARHGFPASPLLAALAPLVAGLPGAEPFRSVTRPGDPVVRPGVADALEAIATDGRSGFYGGAFGRGLLAVGDGEFVDEDLSVDLARWVEPLHLDVWGARLWTAPPGSQGYLTLAGAAIAAGLDLPDRETDLWTHLLVEAAKAAGADRHEVLHQDADGRALLDPARLDRHRRTVSPDRAARLPTSAGTGDTIHLCVVDDDRMGVSLIQSNASGFGVGIVEPATGVFLHNRGIGFDLRPGHPAEYGPGRRPPSTLSPALVTHPDGSLRAVLGTMGGDGQPQVLLQVLARLLQRGRSPGFAIGAPRWVLARRDGRGFDTWTDPDTLVVRIEDDAADRWADGLTRRGHTVEVTGALNPAMGHAHLIEVKADHLAGAADPRALSGAAFGY